MGMEYSSEKAMRRLSRPDRAVKWIKKHDWLIGNVIAVITAVVVTLIVISTLP